MTRSIMTALCFIVLNVSAFAQWIQTSGPEGGGVAALYSDGAALFAGTLGAGVFRSSDGGATWEQKITGMGYQSVNAIARSGGFLLATGTVGVYRSTDGGDSWTLADGTPPANGVRRFAVVGDTVFAGTLGKGVYRSTDNGATWASSSTGLPNSFNQTQIGDLVASGGTLLASASDNSTVGIFRSTDMGGSWTIASAGITGYTNQSALIADGSTIFAGGPTVYKTTNGGDLWVPVATGLPADPAIAQFFLDNATLYAAGAPCSYRSTDGGAHWAAVSGLPREPMLAMCGDGAALYVGTIRDGVYRSTDAGATWSPANGGLRARDMQNLLADGTTLYANGQGAFRTDDEGGSWERLGATLPDTLGALTAVYASGATIFLQDGATGGTLYRSTDGGATWGASATGLPSYPPVAAIAATGGGSLLAAAGDVYASSDNGATWSIANAGMGTYPTITRITAAGSDLYASGNGVYRSTDGGATWSAARTGIPNFYSVDAFCAAGTDLFAGSLYATAIYRSSDNGGSWSAVTGLPFSGAATSFMARGSALFACSPNNGIFVSTNRGGSWTEISGNLPDHTYLYSLAEIGGTLFAGSGAENGVWKRPLSDVTAVADVPGVLPAAFALSQNYPNPFNPSTTIRFTVASAGPVLVTVVDLLGRETATLLSGVVQPGEHEIVWNAANAPSGIYFCRVAAGGETRTRPMHLVR